MRIAATADLHFTPQSYSVLQDQFAKVRDEADVLILAGDLTNFGEDYRGRTTDRCVDSTTGADRRRPRKSRL